MQAEHLSPQGLISIQPACHEDDRGWFAEVFRESWFREHIADVHFIQDNQSLSRRAGTIRGLHFQRPPAAQGKLVRCLNGALFDVAVDLRTGSPTFGAWFGTTLSAENNRQLWIPAGFAHGFATLEPDTVIHYKVTAPYSRADEGGLFWNDPAIGIRWPEQADPDTLSEKDRDLPRLGDLPVPAV